MLTDADIGKLFSVPWSPNPHRLEAIRPRRCQLHGDFIGMEACLRKRRNSTSRPWGHINIVSVDHPGIHLCKETPND